MSNTEQMVSVPVPVALPARKPDMNASFEGTDAEWYGNMSWNAYHDEIAKLGPLYTHADAGEVERLRAELESVKSSRDAFAQNAIHLRAQLSERDVLLQEIRGQSGSSWLRGETQHKLDAAISASAEPSAPTPMPAYMEAACDKFDWAPEEALRFYAEGKHFDTDNGRTRILCTGAVASHALKGMSKEYADLKGSEQGEPSAPKHETCKACHGEGVTRTGIEESPVTLCNHCDGSGNGPSALLIELPGAIERISTNLAAEFQALSRLLAVLSASAEPIPFPGYPPVPEDREPPAEPSTQVERDENAAFESWARSRITPLKLQLDEIGLYHDLVAGTAHDAWQARAALERKP